MDTATRRKRQDALTPEVFARLLEWLDPDREVAGQKYEAIRVRLIKIFHCRGCPIAEDLADATFDRVASKLSDIGETYVGAPALYCYGVAGKIYLEYGRRARLELPLPDDLAETEIAADGVGLTQDCLARCMELLSMRNRELIMAYYGYERKGRDKLARRKALAEKLGIGHNAMWIRAHRIRGILKSCVEQCLQSDREDVLRGANGQKESE